MKSNLIKILCITVGIFTGFSVMGSQERPECPMMPSSGAAMLRGLAKTIQPDRGPLWEVSKNGRKSFLYGTVHVAKLEWDFPGPTIKLALNASDEIAVELDLTDPNLLKRLNTENQANAAKSNMQLTSADDLNLINRVKKQFQIACLDESNFEGATLASKITSLALLSARDKGLHPQNSIDSALIGYARATGKRVFELETSNEQSEALTNDIASVERDISRLESGEAKSQLIRLTSAWADGNFAEIEQYFSWCNCEQDKADLNKLLNQRNIILAERISEAYEMRGHVFAAIGVLHMIGEGNVVERLEKKGFVLKQLTALPEPQ